MSRRATVCLVFFFFILLFRQVEFLQNELEGKSMELESKKDILREFVESERIASEMKDKYNREALQLRQDNSELKEMYEGLKREKKELVAIFA